MTDEEVAENLKKLEGLPMI